MDILEHETQTATENQRICVLNSAPIDLSDGGEWSCRDERRVNTSSRFGSPARISRQFWSASDYEAVGSPTQPSGNVQNRMCVHPKFLHSNATSHKWPFGAVAELLDNAVDEIKKGATRVTVDKVVNNRNGLPALLIQDDGGGMDPDSLRRCMSFGFSDKQSDSSIGQYGNGFKTSTMRLGADVIVFSRCIKSSEPTQSVGLLSYTFLMETGQKDVIVPMVDYKYNPLTGEAKKSDRHSPGNFSSNMSVLMKWSPFPTEEELMQNFDDIGQRGTKIIVFNLWFNDNGNLELDFDTNKEDIIISGTPKPVETNNAVKKLNENHLANQLRYSLRVYASILYLQLPDYFRIILRGQEVKHHYIVTDLRYCECIKYKPQLSGVNEGEVLTTIGFLDGTPHVNVHGFNIYHRNRLILPFQRVLSASGSKGRGIAGVLEANFIKPTHDKQDFEKSSVYQKLESRLKEMTKEYWDYHCHLVGYVIPTHATSVPPVLPTMPLTEHTIAKSSQGSSVAPTLPMAPFGPRTTNASPVTFAHPVRAIPAGTHTRASGALTPHFSSGMQVVQVDQMSSPIVAPSTDLQETRKRKNETAVQMASFRKQATHSPSCDNSVNSCNQMGQYMGERELKEFSLMKLENRKLREECLKFEEAEKELLLKEQKLRLEIEQTEELYKSLLNECVSVAATKMQKC